jgi:hypothetical protein
MTKEFHFAQKAVIEDGGKILLTQKSMADPNHLGRGRSRAVPPASGGLCLRHARSGILVFISTLHKPDILILLQQLGRVTVG